jgi:hypothetical protein
MLEALTPLTDSESQASPGRLANASDDTATTADADSMSDKTLEHVYAILSGEAVVWNERLGGLGADVDCRRSKSPERVRELGVVGKSDRSSSPGRLPTWDEGTATEPPVPVPRARTVPEAAVSEKPKTDRRRDGSTSNSPPRARSAGNYRSAMDVRLEETFKSYCKIERGEYLGMENRSFEKLIRDCNLYDYDKKGDFTKEKGGADLIFAAVVRSKGQGQRLMDLSGFKEALAEIAQKRGCSEDEIQGLVARSAGPVANATLPEATHFHSDARSERKCKRQSQPRMKDPLDSSPILTQEHSNNHFAAELRPNLNDKPVAQERRESIKLTDRIRTPPQDCTASETSPAAVPSQFSAMTNRSSPGGQSTRHSSNGGVTGFLPQSRAPSSPPISPEFRYTPPPASNDDGDLRYDIERIFMKFCERGHTKLDATKFQKVCKDCHLFDAKFASHDADLIFKRVKLSREVKRASSTGANKLDLEEFFEALRLVAEKKDVDQVSVLRLVADSNGPNMIGTKAEPVRFHDDESLHTGTHKCGGPESAPRGPGTGLAPGAILRG